MYTPASEFFSVCVIFLLLAGTYLFFGIFVLIFLSASALSRSLVPPPNFSPFISKQHPFDCRAHARPRPFHSSFSSRLFSNPFFSVPPPSPLRPPILFFLHRPHYKPSPTRCPGHPVLFKSLFDKNK